MLFSFLDLVNVRALISALFCANFVIRKRKPKLPLKIYIYILPKFSFSGERLAACPPPPLRTPGIPCPCIHCSPSKIESACKARAPYLASLVGTACKGCAAVLALSHAEGSARSSLPGTVGPEGWTLRIQAFRSDRSGPRLLFCPFVLAFYCASLSFLVILWP